MDKIKQKIKSVVSHDHKATKLATSETVLITGASGFIGAHVLNVFLEKGYNVRAAVRTEASSESIKKSHAKYVSKLSFTVVGSDITIPGVFDEAVKDVHGVVHLASPFVMSVEDNVRDLLDPAKKGTLGLFESIQKHNPAVTRVVLTSSFAAIVDMSKGAWPEHTYTEADWNPCTWEEAATGPGPVAYCASKTFAERAAFDYVKDKSPNFTVKTICPPMVFSPNAHTVTDMSKLNTSSATIYGLCNGTADSVPETAFFAYVDVRDVAEAHLRAYELPDATNERFFVTGGSYSFQQIVDILRTFPQLKDKTPEGKPGTFPEGEVYKVDNAQAETKLGIEFISLEKCIKDTAETLIRLEKETGNAS